MDSTFILLSILTAVTFVHLPLAIMPAIEAIVPSLFPTCKNKYSNYHPGNNILRSIGSLAFLILPIFIFRLYKSLAVENELAHNAIICLFICLTLYLIYFNRTSFWSKNFKTVENPKIIIDKRFSSCEKTISKNRDDINFLQDKSSNTDFLLNESSKALNFKIDDTKESIKNVTKNLNKIGDAEKKKLKAKVELENKCFKDYFKTEETFEKFEKLLHNNDFYLHKNNLTATNLCILTCKLLDLKALSINKKQEYYCIAIAKYFNVPEFDKSNLSRAKKNNENGSFSIAHKELFHALKYLDKLNKR